MASLTEISYYSRKGVNIFIIGIVVIIVGRFLIFGALALKEHFFPTPLPPANNALGTLPYPNFQGSEATPSGLTYTLETVDGTLPVLPRTLTAFALEPEFKVTFGTFDRMKSVASQMGFTSDPQKKEGSTYEFQDPANSQRTLLIDELSGNFEVKYNYSSDLGVFNDKDLSSKEAVIAKARGFFENLGLYTPDLATGSAEVTYMRLSGQNLTKTTSLANSDAVYVDFKRADVNDLPVVYPNAAKGLVSALVVKDVLEARYYHASVDANSFGTYDPITTKSAFESLKNGQAIFASLPDPLPKSIPIREVHVGYLDPFPPQGFLQPVIVFSDDKDFEAYVPALRY